MKENKLIVKVNESEFNVDVIDGAYHINGKQYDVNLIKQLSKDVQALSINNKIYTLGIENKSDGEKKIRLENFDYNVSVKTEKFAKFEKYMQVKSGGAGKGGKVKAPMPGLVVKINVQIGDEVKKGDKLISLEAMKMENAISASAAGTVKQILVKEGQTVEKDAVLLEIE